MRALAERLIERGAAGGRVVNISTDSARAFPGQVFYGTSKTALEAMTRAAAIELGPHGITVNAVAPGPVQTGWIDDTLPDQVLPSIPLRRLGTPDDFAQAVAFLLSDAAPWITGQVIQVAGGHALQFRSSRPNAEPRRPLAFAHMNLFVYLYSDGMLSISILLSLCLNLRSIDS